MPSGTVKWFNNAKGYGFIVADDQNEDMFAHYSSIQMDGYRTLKAGQKVNFDTKPADNGIHAINISVIGASSSQTEDESHLAFAKSKFFIPLYKKKPRNCEVFLFNSTIITQRLPRLMLH